MNLAKFSTFTWYSILFFFLILFLFCSFSILYSIFLNFFFYSSISSSQCYTQVRRASKPLWMHQNTVEYIVSAIETICTTQDMAQVLQKLSALQKNNNMAGLIRTIEKVVDWFQPLVGPV